jgi:hypothetical protein
MFVDEMQFLLHRINHDKIYGIKLIRIYILNLCINKRRLWTFNLSTDIESTTFWDISPYSLAQIYRRFGGTFCRHFQGRRVSQATTKVQAGR